LPASLSWLTEFVDLLFRAHVDPARRLVEEDDVRVGHQRFAQDYLLLVSAGELSR
jgi:hypothetical protein